MLVTEQDRPLRNWSPRVSRTLRASGPRPSGCAQLAPFRTGDYRKHR
jgi:hypothetical protein